MTSWSSVLLSGTGNFRVGEFLPPGTASCSLCELSCTRATGSYKQHTWHRGCLQTSWLEANFHLLLKIKGRHVSAILVFDCTSCQYVLSPPGAKKTKKTESFPPVQTDSVGGKRGEQGTWALGLPVWGSHLPGERSLAIQPFQPLACSNYGYATESGK